MDQHFKTRPENSCEADYVDNISNTFDSDEDDEDENGDVDEDDAENDEEDSSDNDEDGGGGSIEESKKELDSLTYVLSPYLLRDHPLNSLNYIVRRD